MRFTQHRWLRPLSNQSGRSTAVWQDVAMLGYPSGSDHDVYSYRYQKRGNFSLSTETSPAVAGGDTSSMLRLRCICQVVGCSHAGQLHCMHILSLVVFCPFWDRIDAIGFSLSIFYLLINDSRLHTCTHGLEASVCYWPARFSDRAFSFASSHFLHSFVTIACILSD